MFTSSTPPLSPREQLEVEIERIFAQKPLADEYVEFILGSYSEPWRRYHNCEHILKMLDWLQATKIPLDSQYLTALEVMVIYHDVIYKIGREKAYNECASATIAGKHLQSAGYDSIFVELVTEGVECTIAHQVKPDLPMWSDFIQPLIDIDLLAGMGKSGDDFTNNTELIRQEYSPLYTDAEIARGRAKWAKSMLTRPSIYLSSYFQQYEAYARENLGRLVED
jgi:predicted metal-dependent HD superfamily phosphohydrolase